MEGASPFVEGEALFMEGCGWRGQSRAWRGKRDADLANETLDGQAERCRELNGDAGRLLVVEIALARHAEEEELLGAVCALDAEGVLLVVDLVDVGGGVSGAVSLALSLSRPLALSLALTLLALA